MALFGLFGKKNEEKTEDKQDVFVEKQENESERLQRKVQEGIEAFNNKKYEEAIACWKESVKKGDIQVIIWSAHAYAILDDYKESLEHLKKISNVELDEAFKERAGMIEKYCLSKRSEIFNEGAKYYNTGNYENAIKCFTTAAEQGHLKAQILLAKLYSRGENIQKDKKEAYKWYELAAKQGDVESQREIGIRYFYGDGHTVDMERGIQWLTMAAEQGDTASQIMLADIYYEGNGADQNIKHAMKWYTVLAENGNEKAQRQLFNLYKQVGTYYNEQEALRWGRVLAESGDPLEQCSFGRFCYKDIGTEEAKKEACKWYKMSAEQGCVGAKTYLAQMYEKGDGAPKNIAVAQRLYLEAADGEEMQAVFKAAQMYHYGEGVIPNNKKALELYEKVARYNGEAAYILAGIYQNGSLGEKDWDKAAGFYKDAVVDRINVNLAMEALEKLAEQNCVKAAFELFNIYSYGFGGIEKDKEKALYWEKLFL